MTSRTFAAVGVAALMGSAPLAAQRGPSATALPLAADVIGLACAPMAAHVIPDTPLRVTGGQDVGIRHTHAEGDLITINAGSQNGIEVGQEYYTRRILIAEREQISPTTPATVMTSGWIRVYAVDDTLSLATITHACDTIDVGDHLEPFVLPTVPMPASRQPKPERDNYGRVLTGESRKRLFGKGDYFLLDRGSNQGIKPGAQFVLYRNKQQPENFLYDLGEAVAVDVKEDSSTLQVTVSRDAIMEGDLVAIRK